MTTSRATGLRTWLIWTAGFLAFPLPGLAGTAVVGRVDSPVAALVAYGAITFSALSGLLLLRLLPERPAAGTPAAPTPVGARA